jgi:hypothetical protein
MSSATKKLKPKKKCCDSKSRCRRCPVRLKAEAAKRKKKKRKK